ncbi:MAG: HAD hydrolase-like protein [Verrucomicrobiota bacterium]
MIRLVLFDIDGTLVRTHGAGVKAFLSAFDHEFKLPCNGVRLSFAGRTDTSLVREFFKLHRREPTREDFDRFFDRYVFLLEHNLQHGKGHIIPGVWEWLEQLAALPQPPLIGLLTGNVRLGAEIKLRHFNCWERFAIGAFADDHEDRDQIAAIAFARGRQLLGPALQPHEVLVIGDTPHDVRCGKSIGARVLAVATGGAKLPELLASQPDWAVNDLLEIRAASVIHA